MADDKKNKPNWTFLTNHAHILLCLAQSNTMRSKDIAEAVGITERAVQRIISELSESGYLQITRSGRCNSYKINLKKNLKHPLEAKKKISALISLIHD